MNVGGWVPDPDRLNSWIENRLNKVGDKPRGGAAPEEELPTIQAFRKLIETDPEIYMGFHRLFEGVPETDPAGHPQVTDYDTMLRLFDGLIKEAPEYDKNFLVFLPFTAILQWPMATTNGLTVMIDPKVNLCIRNMFNAWSSFLNSSDSRYVLTTDEKGWLGPEAMEQMPDFKQTFVCDPSKPHWGFDSWDHFFARKLTENGRPVDSPEDSSVITSACESKVLRVATNVQKRDTFWLKGQPYSLVHMLNNNPQAASFVGGTVYQAFLSPFYYHRWASPVEGVVTHTEVVEGTYFAGLPYDAPPPEEFWANQGQQPFIAHVATRALIFIRANDPKIGLLCFVGIGMVEVSSCDITVYAGQKVKKGQEIGTFHFGGSTHCLVFGPNVELEFKVKTDDFVHVHKTIATLK